MTAKTRIFRQMFLFINRLHFDDGLESFARRKMIRCNSPYTRWSSKLKNSALRAACVLISLLIIFIWCESIKLFGMFSLCLRANLIKFRRNRFQIKCAGWMSFWSKQTLERVKQAVVTSNHKNILQTMNGIRKSYTKLLALISQSIESTVTPLENQTQE